MVLWEITAVTAYFLGLKRTYRLALRIQRRIIGPNHPKLRDFAYRQTRTVFDAAFRVHQNIQQRDIDVGKSLGNKILRWLDRMKPSAQIRRGSTKLNYQGTPAAKPTKDSQPSTEASGIRNKKNNGDHSNGRVLASALNSRLLNSETSVRMILPPRKATGSLNSRYRHTYNHATSGYGWFNGVFRRDIAEWMQR